MPVNLTETARELRKNMTDVERVLWKRLKSKQLGGFKFRRQEQIGRFIADFVCFERGIIIEADGGQHAIEREKDEERTQWLNSQGYTVLRFWNNDILTTPLPGPLPQRGEGAKTGRSLDEIERWSRQEGEMEKFEVFQKKFQEDCQHRDIVKKR